jgi:hypothetical protein
MLADEFDASGNRNCDVSIVQEFMELHTEDHERSDSDESCSEVKSHLGSHLPTPVTRLYTQHTNRHPGVASSDTMGEGDRCKGKLDL